MKQSRRRFIKIALTSLAAMPAIFSSRIQAAEEQLIPLKESDTMAVQFQYKDDIEATDPKPSNFKPGSDCANCLLFKTANNGCGIFPGKSVKPKGWCLAWAPRPN